jgi:hypothetical protein
MAIKTFSVGEVLTASDTNTYLANSGLVYITSTTMGTTTSISNCFTSTYSHYRIIVSANISTAAAITLRLRASGSDNSTANYKWIYFDQNVSSTATAAPASISGWNDTQFYVSNSGNGGADTALAWIDVFNPQAAVKTTYAFQTIFEWSSGVIYNRQGGGNFNGTTQFDGFSLLSSATTTGTVTVMGYRKA